MVTFKEIKLRLIYVIQLLQPYTLALPCSEESSLFKISLAGFRVDTDNMFGDLQHLATKYNWRLVMSAVLEAASGYKELADMEPLVRTGVHKLIFSPQVISWCVSQRQIKIFHGLYVQP